MKWCKKIESDYGNYTDDAGNRYIIDCGDFVQAPDHKQNNELGYEQFVDEKEAALAWGLHELTPDEMMRKR